MYRILKKKRGKPNSKNLLVFYLSKGTSKFVLQIVAKKFYKTSPKFFVLNKKPEMLRVIFYKLSHREEFKKVHVELFLSVTGLLYSKVVFNLYEGYNFIKKQHIDNSKFDKSKIPELLFI